MQGHARIAAMQQQLEPSALEAVSQSGPVDPARGSEFTARAVRLRRGNNVPNSGPPLVAAARTLC